jgi:hypothetical protein
MQTAQQIGLSVKLSGLRFRLEQAKLYKTGEVDALKEKIYEVEKEIRECPV